MRRRYERLWRAEPSSDEEDDSSGDGGGKSQAFSNYNLGAPGRLPKPLSNSYERKAQGGGGRGEEEVY